MSYLMHRFILQSGHHEPELLLFHAGIEGQPFKNLPRRHHEDAGGQFHLHSAHTVFLVVFQEVDLADCRVPRHLLLDIRERIENIDRCCSGYVEFPESDRNLHVATFEVAEIPLLRLLHPCLVRPERQFQGGLVLVPGFQTLSGLLQECSPNAFWRSGTGRTALLIVLDLTFWRYTRSAVHEVTLLVGRAFATIANGSKFSRTALLTEPTYQSFAAIESATRIADRITTF
mmetsp:Transcript_9340/g.16528  ORF Transcript_9340/g.16528 Transcript_9340/m.16528 type:complete len:230 (+) Transcript_9340:657-1346(+)